MSENEDGSTNRNKIIEAETLIVRRQSEHSKYSKFASDLNPAQALTNEDLQNDEEKLTIFKSSLKTEEKSKKKQSRVSFEETENDDLKAEIKKKIEASRNTHEFNINLPNDETHRGNSHTNLNISINIHNISPTKKTIVYIHSQEQQEEEYTELARDTSPNKPQVTESPITDLWQINEKIGFDSITAEPKIGRNATGGVGSSSGTTSSPKKNWKKLSNLFRSLNSFHKYETKNIIDDTEFDVDLKDYKTRLFDNTIKVRKSTLDESKRSLFDSKLVRILEDDKANINFKEEIYKLIVNGDITAVKKIDALIKKDPAYYLNDIKDPNFKLNTPLGNGKTLIYIACQEGKIDVVKYLLEKNLNPFVMSKMDGNELESPLGVASRWNFINIVELLLNSVKYEKNHIEQVLLMNGLTKKVRKILKIYYKDKFNINKCCG